MNQQTVNPYSPLASLAGIPGILDIIGTNGPYPDVPSLVTEIYSQVWPLFYQSLPSNQLQVELQSIGLNAANAYSTNLVLQGKCNFNAKQMQFIELLIGSAMTANTSPASVGDVIADIEDNIGTSLLTTDEQAPLFLATLIGAITYTYWSAQVMTPTTWSLFITPSLHGQNYMSSLLWNVAAMNGALAGYGANYITLMEPTINMVTNKMVAALIGALTATAGKVIFNWNPARITKPLTLDMSRISSISNNNTIPFNNNNPNYFLFSLIGSRCHTCSPNSRTCPSGEANPCNTMPDTSTCPTANF